MLIVCVSLLCGSNLKLFYISRVTSHNVHARQVVIVDGGEEFLVDTVLIEPYDFTPGYLYIFTGILAKNAQSRMTLKARTVACANGLDIDIFVKVLEQRRKFLKE